MSCTIKGTTISLTRGDTMNVKIVPIIKDTGDEYVPVEGDKFRFAMKAYADDEYPLIEKNIPIDTMILVLEPGDTKDLDFGNYVYDIEVTHSEDGDYHGAVDTFIADSIFKVTREVH